MGSSGLGSGLTSPSGSGRTADTAQQGSFGSVQKPDPNVVNGKVRLGCGLVPSFHEKSGDWE